MTCLSVFAPLLAKGIGDTKNEMERVEPLRLKYFTIFCVIMEC